MISKSGYSRVVIQRKAVKASYLMDETQCTNELLSSCEFTHYPRQQIQQRVWVGNIYVNRKIMGASVGVQPFGGERLSGAEPKAAGPRYLYRFYTESVLTRNCAAIGRNANLLSLK